ncbi:MAG: hypothetical protein A2Y61_06640 [Chloroflexi bacterium RBG_13_60_13]|nr:MAG: hypothetical protein A2Y61_06640 [Chloroflexi bacterium RBG_13_60_13]
MTILDVREPGQTEGLVILSMLLEEPLAEPELRRRLRAVRGKQLAPRSHLYSSHDKWIRNLKNDGLIRESGGVLRLTGLGYWIADSQLGTPFQRYSLVMLRCQICSPLFVLRTPLPETIARNPRGYLVMDMSCPRCGDHTRRYPWGGIASRDEFIEFYNLALPELQQSAGLEARPIRLVAQKAC